MKNASAKRTLNKRNEAMSPDENYDDEFTAEFSSLKWGQSE